MTARVNKAPHLSLACLHRATWDQKGKSHIRYDTSSIYTSEWSVLPRRYIWPEVLYSLLRRERSSTLYFIFLSQEKSQFAWLRPFSIKVMFTLVNLQRQLVMIRRCAKNNSSVTPRCGRFFCDICSAATRWKCLKAIQKCNVSANLCEKHALRIGVASWRCKLTSVTSPLDHNASHACNQNVLRHEFFRARKKPLIRNFIVSGNGLLGSLPTILGAKVQQSLPVIVHISAV